MTSHDQEWPGQPTTAPPPGPAPRRGIPWWAPVAAVGAVVAIGAGVLVATGGGETRLSEAEFASQVGALCEDFDDNSEALEGDTFEPDAFVARMDDQRVLLDDLLVDLGDVRPPEEREEPFDRLVEGLRTMRGQVSDARAAVTGGGSFGELVDDIDAIMETGRELDAISEDLDLDECVDDEEDTGVSVRGQLTEGIASQWTGGPIPVSDADATCLSDEIFDLPADEGMAMAASLGGDLPEAGEEALAAAFDACIPLAEFLAEGFVTAGFPREVASCVARGLGDEITWIDAVRGSDFEEIAGPRLPAVLADCGAG